jgi:hypothetical protein
MHSFEQKKKPDLLLDRFFGRNLVLHWAQIFSFIANPLSNNLGDELTHQQTALSAVHL